MSQKSQSPLDKHRKKVEQLLLAGSSISDAVRQLKKKGVNTSDQSIRRAIKRWGWEHASVEGEASELRLDEDNLDVIGAPSAQWTTPEDLLRDRGLDPEDWANDSFRVSEWEDVGGGVKHSLRAHYRRTKPVNWVWPAKFDSPPPVKKSRKAKPTSSTRLVVFVGDQQAPYHDKNLHELFCQWLEYNHPDEGVHLGDLLDFPNISRHPTNPAWNATAQESLDAAYLIARDYVYSSPDTDWVMLEGNHEWRLKDKLLQTLPNFYGITPAEIPGEAKQEVVLSIPKLLHFDSLGIQYLHPNGKWTHAQHKVSDYLAARHGWLARKGSGATALETLKHMGHSIVVGHTHRQSIVTHTTYDIDGEPSTLTAAEAGAMCEIKEGLGHSVAVDWVQGFATATVHPDGRFRLEHGTYVNGELYWRDQRYS